MNSRKAGVYFELGKSCRSQGRWPDAEAALKKALELDPKNGWIFLELGTLYLDQGRLSEAGAGFKEAIAANLNSGGVYGQLGRVYSRRRRWPEAEAAFKKALAIDPRIDWVYVELGSFYKDRGRFPEAEAAFQNAIACGPRNGGAHFQLGNIYRLRGRWGEAEAEFKEALEIDPENDRAYMGLWAIYGRQGRMADAEAASRNASAINPGNAWACAGAQEHLDLDSAIGDGPNLSEPGREQVFCLLPWTLLHVRTDGLLRPCCAWSGPPLGDARSSLIDDLRNSPGMKALRLDMISGHPVTGCWRCYKNEKAGLLSLRQKYNFYFDHHRGRERLTAPDGTLPRLPVPMLHIRFSNACNLRCRICNPMQSSAWMEDSRALGWPVEGGPIQKPYDDWDSLWRQLQPMLEDRIEEIVFEGGEPLLMEEHYRILDFLIARKLTHVRLTYNTNFSTLRYQGRDVIDLWSRFHDISVAASLDGSGRRGEYLRKGLHWDAVEANREEMLRRCPDVEFSISATVSIFNALHLSDFHREWVEKGYIERNEFALNMLVVPEMYCMQVLPAALKSRTLESYRQHQEIFLDADGAAARDFALAARFLEAQDYSELLPGFLAMTRRLDELRGEDCREVFPELAALFEAAG